MRRKEEERQAEARREGFLSIVEARLLGLGICSPITWTLGKMKNNKKQKVSMKEQATKTIEVVSGSRNTTAKGSALS